MKRAVVYIRVSSAEQVKNMSLATQLRECRLMCDREKWDVVEVFEDAGASAKSDARPAFQKAISFATEKRNCVDLFVAFAIDRFARNMADHMAYRSLLLTKNVKLRTVREGINESPNGELIEGIHALMAQHENRIKGERTLLGMKAALSAGRWQTRPPLGYRMGNRDLGEKSLVIDDDRAPLIRRAFELVGDDGRSQADACREVNALGLRTLSGKPVTAQTFSKMLRQTAYKGMTHIKAWNEVVPGDFEQVVDTLLFDRVQSVLDGKTTQGKRLDDPELLLRRFARCSSCGSKLTGSPSKNHAKKIYYYYRCPKRECSEVKSIPRDKLDALFRGHLSSMAVPLGVVELFREVVKRQLDRRSSGRETSRARLTARLTDIEAKMDRLLEAHVFEGAIEQSVYVRAEARISADKAEIEMQLQRLEDTAPDIERLLTLAERVLIDPAGAWSTLPHRAKLDFQWFVFPGGIETDGTSIGTTQKANAFDHLWKSKALGSLMVTPTGLEPVLPA